MCAAHKMFMTNNTFDPAKHLRGKDKPTGQAPAANKGGFVPMDPKTDAGSEVGDQLTKGSTPLDDQLANRWELRGLAEDCTDMMGNVHRISFLSWLDALDEQRGADGAVERAEMREAMATASDDQGNVSRDSLHSALGAQSAAPAAEELAPFTWDKDYKNNEQVRPYYAGYLAERKRIEARGEYTYNDSFKGKIPGLEDPNEDTGIFLLQTMHRLDTLAVQVADFRAEGAVDCETLEAGHEYRGTVVAHGFYSGGTGWKQYNSARLVKDQNGRLIITEARKRNGRYLMSSAMILVDDGKKARG